MSGVRARSSPHNPRPRRPSGGPLTRVYVCCNSVARAGEKYQKEAEGLKEEYDKKKAALEAKGGKPAKKQKTEKAAEAEEEEEEEGDDEEEVHIICTSKL